MLGDTADFTNKLKSRMNVEQLSQVHAQEQKAIPVESVAGLPGWNGVNGVGTI